MLDSALPSAAFEGFRVQAFLEVVGLCPSALVGEEGCATLFDSQKSLDSPKVSRAKLKSHPVWFQRLEGLKVI